MSLDTKQKSAKKPATKIELTIGFIILFTVVALIVWGIVASVSAIGHAIASHPKTTANLTTHTKQTANTKPVAKPSQPTQQTAPTAQQSTSPVLTGYGAMQADWNANHQADTRYDSGAVYDPTPGLGTDERHDAKYYSVSTQDGRILTYAMRLPNKSNLTAAQVEVMQEFPTDAKVVWQQTQDQCSQMEISSVTLGNTSVLGGSSIGDPQGQVFVEFQTDSTSTSGLNSYYDASNVNLATLTLGSYNTAADAPGC
jgi:hypothetical protein